MTDGTEVMTETREPCEICASEKASWTGHGWFCQPCRDRVVRKFRAGVLDAHDDTHVL
jgi:hypothetical protein